MDHSKISKQKVPALRHLLSQKGLSTKGNKDALVKRLLADANEVGNNSTQYFDATSDSDEEKPTTFETVALVHQHGAGASPGDDSRVQAGHSRHSNQNLTSTGFGSSRFARNHCESDNITSIGVGSSLPSGNHQHVRIDQITSSGAFALPVDTNRVMAGQTGSTPNPTSSLEMQFELFKLEKERELLALERKLFAAEKAAQTGVVNAGHGGTIGEPRGGRFTYQQIADSLPFFDPSNTHGMTANKFISKIDKLNAVYGWEDQLLLYASQSKLRGYAKMWIDSCEETFSTFIEFADALCDEYPDTACEADIQRQLVLAKRTSTESVRDFCFRMSAIGRQANMSDSTIVSHILRGIHHKELNTALSGMEFTRLRDFHSAVARFERQAATAPTATVFTPTQNTSTGAKPKVMKAESEANAVRRTAAMCYNCNESGHKLADCSKPRVRCENCKRHGHSTKDCTYTRNEQVRHVKDGKALEKPVDVGGKSMIGYLDGGSNRSLIGRTAAAQIGGVESCTPFVIRGFGANPITCDFKINTDVKVDGEIYSGDIHLVDDEHLEVNEILLGTKLLCADGKRLVIGEGECFVLPQTNENDDKVTTQEKVKQLLGRYKQCFSENLQDIGICKTTSMKIELTTDVPVRLRPHRVPFAKQEAVKTMVNDLLDNGIITKSKSAYASPIVMVKKTNGEDRMCVDFRALNQITVRQPFPMPVMDELMAKLAGSTYFTSMDLISGYHQIPIDPESQKFTAFVTSDGHYEYKRMPFGLVNAAAVFQTLMEEIVTMMPAGELVAYLDDTVIPSATIEEGLERLERFLQILAKVGLTLRRDKCVFLQERIKFLGHTVTCGGVEPGDDKVAAIRNFEVPKNVHDVRRFLGLTGFFRKFVQHHAVIARPLNDLLKSKATFQWGEQQTKAFDELRRRLCSEPVLVLYDVNKRHEVHTDASSVGLAGVLLQEDSEGRLRPVFYYSRHCTEAESRYASHELEVLAIVETLERFRFYLIGKHFRVVTDCAAVATTKTTKQLVPRIARWWLKLQEYDFDLLHRPGVQMAHVDALSRAPYEPAREVPVVTERILRVEVDQNDWLLTMQHQDPKLRHIMAVLTGDGQADDEQQLRLDYLIDKNRLFRKLGTDKKWVVPDAIRWRIVKSAHDDRGHFALEKTMENISEHFWFRRMRNYVKGYLAACIECAYNRKPAGAVEGRLQISATIPIPFRSIHMDHLGPFQRSSSGNAYVLGISDSFSKYVIVKAVKSTNTRSVVRALIDMTNCFGLPNQIITDRGTAFTSKDFAAYCTCNNIRHIQNAVRTPRANGQIERVNQYINRFLRTVTEDARKWDVNLWKLQWVVNSQTNKSNGCSPNEVVFRYKPRDVLRNKVLAVLQENQTTTDDEDDIPLAEIARRADAEKIKWKVRFDSKHRTPTKYDEGDMVLIENVAAATGESRKLEPKYRGPYIIKKVLDMDRFLVGDIENAPRTQKPFLSVFTSDKLKRWCSLGPDDDDNQAEEEDSDDEVEDGTNEASTSGTSRGRL